MDWSNMAGQAGIFVYDRIKLVLEGYTLWISLNSTPALIHWHFLWNEWYIFWLYLLSIHNQTLTMKHNGYLGRLAGNSGPCRWIWYGGNRWLQFRMWLKLVIIYYNFMPDSGWYLEFEHDLCMTSFYYNPMLPCSTSVWSILLRGKTVHCVTPIW